MLENKRILQYEPFKLKTTKEDGYVATMNFSSKNFYPNITVFVGPYRDKDNNVIEKNKITINTTTTNILVILSDFKTIIRNKSADSKSYLFYKNTFTEDGKMLEQMSLAGKLTIGKDEEGVNYIELTEEGKEVVRFKLLADARYFKCLDSENKEITDLTILSGKYATKWVSMLESLLYKEFTEACMVNPVVTAEVLPKIKVDKPLV